MIWTPQDWLDFWDAWLVEWTKEVFDERQWWRIAPCY